MGNLGEIGIQIAGDKVFVKGRKRKLLLIGHKCELNQPDAKTALKVFREAEAMLERIKKAVAGVPQCQPTHLV